MVHVKASGDIKIITLWPFNKIQENLMICLVLRESGRQGEGGWWFKTDGDWGLWEGGLLCSGGGFAVQQFLHHELGVANAAGQLFAAAKLLQQRKLVGAEVPLLIDVGHCSHQRTQDQLGVVLAGGNEHVGSGFVHSVKGWKLDWNS